MSSTESGFSDTLSMPCSISQRARSGGEDIAKAFEALAQLFVVLNDAVGYRKKDAAKRLHPED